jgi:hypothetical protein
MKQIQRQQSNSFQKHRPKLTIVRPEGKFQRQPSEQKAKFGPRDCTSINPNSQMPVLPEMIYIRPA